MGGSAEEVKPDPPKPEQGKTWTEPITGMEFVWIEGGCFQMGSPPEGHSADEGPVHKVCVDGFQIGKYEVTNAEYVRFLNQVKKRGTTGRPWFETEQEDGDSKIQGEIGRFIIKPGYEQHPVNNVSWYGAVAYADWLGQHAGKKFRFPNEAEWEYAARGGVDSRGFIYAGSNQLEQVGWYNGNSKSMTHQVGQLAANELGLHDMSGNLWEWCADWYDSKYYAERVRDNPQGPAEGSARVVRGGGYFRGSLGCRSVRRSRYRPEGRNGGLGFRLVLPFQAAGS